MDKKDLNELIELNGVLDCLKEKYSNSDTKLLNNEELIYNLKNTINSIDKIIVENQK